MTVHSRRKLMKAIDVELVKKAIQDAEVRTSGEIRVSVAPFFWGPVRRVAEKAFVRLNMNRTRARNGILFFIVPSRRKFVVLGDEGIHASAGQEFWESLASILAGHFRKSEFTEGLVEAIGEAGLKLAAHFPYDRTTDVNELPDDVDFGK